MSRFSAMLLTLALVAVLPASAQADDVLQRNTANGFNVSADAGVAAFAGAGNRLHVRFGSGPVTRTSRTISSSFDVGRRPGGGARLAYADGCSRKRKRCTVFTIDLEKGAALRRKRLTRIPFNGGTPALALDRDQLAYTVRRGRCDVPYAGRVARPARKLDRGECSRFLQIDLEGRRLGALASYDDGGDTYYHDLRLMRTTGGKSRAVVSSAASQEPAFLTGVAFDGGSIYTANSGNEDEEFVRVSLKTGKTTRADTYTGGLAGGFTRDGGRQLFVDRQNGSVDGRCADKILGGCILVGGQDPFRGERLLTPELLVTGSAKSVFADTPLTITARLTRPRVGPDKFLGHKPIAGVPVVLHPNGQPAGAPQRTDANGTVSVTVPPVIPGFLHYVARTTVPVGGGIVEQDSSYIPDVNVRVAAQIVRDGDRIRATGTISPPLPGARIDVQRLVDTESYQDVGFAETSGDGSTFTINAGVEPAGTYRVRLHPDTSGYVGTTPPVTINAP